MLELKKFHTLRPDAVAVSHAPRGVRADTSLGSWYFIIPHKQNSKCKANLYTVHRV